MNDWKKSGPHDCYDAHQVVIPCVREHEHGFGCLATEFCPGGSPVTAADLEGLGERYWECEQHQSGMPRHSDELPPLGIRCDAARANQLFDCNYKWRLLIPIPDPQPATKLTDYDYETEGLGGT